jgi:hypothetical protein
MDETKAGQEAGAPRAPIVQKLPHEMTTQDGAARAVRMMAFHLGNAQHLFAAASVAIDAGDHLSADVLSDQGFVAMGEASDAQKQMIESWRQWIVGLLDARNASEAPARPAPPDPLSTPRSDK